MVRPPPHFNESWIRKWWDEWPTAWPICSVRSVRPSISEVVVYYTIQQELPYIKSNSKGRPDRCIVAPGTRLLVVERKMFLHCQIKIWLLTYQRSPHFNACKKRKWGRVHFNGQQTHYLTNKTLLINLTHITSQLLHMQVRWAHLYGSLRKL